MENITQIARLLGEENAKRLRDEITDMLIQQVDRDLEDRYKYEYIIAFDYLYEEVKEQIEEEFKEKLAAKYRDKMNKILEKIEV